MSSSTRYFFVVDLTDKKGSLRPPVCCLEGGKLFLKDVEWNTHLLAPQECADESEALRLLAQRLQVDKTTLKFVPALLSPGQKHPRIARNWYNLPISKDIRRRDEDELDYIRATAGLWSWLNRLFRYIEPTPENMSAYGHEMRHLLIAACTEVEAAWSGVLSANKYESKREKWTTNDYVKLLGPMRLNDYGVQFVNQWTDHPLFPFHKWDPTQPTQSLEWYDAYNTVKHNRRVHLKSANLRNVICAMAAVAVMGIAQFGHVPRLPYSGPSLLRYKEFSVPKWRAPDLYFGPQGIAQWSDKPFWNGS